MTMVRMLLLLRYLVWAAAFAVLLVSSMTEATNDDESNKPPLPPKLSGQHFRITGLPTESFLNIDEINSNNIINSSNSNNNAALNYKLGIEFSGYLVEMLRYVAAKANFTYEFLTPSGFGSQCNPQLNISDTSTFKYAYGRESGPGPTHTAPMTAPYRVQYNCGANDVNEMQGTDFYSDMYLGLFYISPERQLLNWFTVPFQPPYIGTPAMYGFATGIPTIQDLIKQQAEGKQPPACTIGSTANAQYLKDRFPDLQLREYFTDILAPIDAGECPVSIFTAPGVTQLTLARYREGRCLIGGKPVGMIGEPLNAGMSHFAIGVGKHLDRQVVDVLDYWINTFIVDGTLASLYQGGTGKECGYVLYPPEEKLLSEGAIAGVVLGSVAGVFIALYFLHLHKLRRQQKRYKKRFVQQIARNIEIGRRPGCISPGQLSEQILHIGQGKEVISKYDLSKWLHDIKMNFLTEKDFNALWNAMDVDRTGNVDAVEFVVFLSACGPEFEEVYEEQEKLPKIEKLKLAARRLSNLEDFGEEGVRRMEQSLDRSSRGFVPGKSSSSFNLRASAPRRSSLVLENSS